MADKHWMNTYYVFEIFMFLVGLALIWKGYSLKYNLFSGIGVGFVVFGMLIAFMQKRTFVF